MIASKQNSEPTELILRSIDELETSVINYFQMSDKLIQAAQVRGQDHGYEYNRFKLAFGLHSYFSHLIELQKNLFKKRTVIIYSLSNKHSVHKADAERYDEKYKQNQYRLKTYLKRNIELIFSHDPFHEELYLLTEQLEETLHYANKNKYPFMQINDEETYPKPAPPLLNIKKVTQKNKNKYNA